ncbi:nucleolar complex protein 4 homolog [Styela clava]
MAMSLKSINNLVEELLQSRQNCNKIVDLIPLINFEENEEVLNVILDGVGTYFCNAICNNELTKQKGVSKEMSEYQEWINIRYNECLAKIVLLLDHDSDILKEKCIVTVLRFMESKIGVALQKDNVSFPETELESLICAFIINDTSNHMQDVCTNIWKLDDVRYFALKCITKCSAECLSKIELKSMMLQNIFTLLNSISESMPAVMDETNLHTLANNGVERIFPAVNKDPVVTEKYQDSSIPFPKALDLKEQRKIFGNAWLEFLNYDLDSHLFKSVLVILQKCVIPNFASPCILADFLTRSFNKGGGIALLSLHSLFILMNEHNLEYPDFYTHLYSMVHPRVFDAKYQPRFFFLLDVFLSSTHLPAYLVAAFAKRLSRLTLVAPTCAQELLVNFIQTLIDRHPSIKILINQNTKALQKKALAGDPYLEAEVDPAKCKAMESFLWELTALSKHCSSSVSAAIKNIDKGPKQDITDLLENTYEEMFDTLCEKEIVDAPMNYRAPKTLFGGFDDAVMELWSV